MENISSTQNQFSTEVESNIIFDYKQELEKYKLLYDAEQQEVIRLRKKQENIDIAFITLKNMTEKVVSLYKENMNLKTELANLHSFISEYYRSEATSIEKVFPMLSEIDQLIAKYQRDKEHENTTCSVKSDQSSNKTSQHSDAVITAYN